MDEATPTELTDVGARVPLHAGQPAQCLRWDASGQRWWWTEPAAGIVRSWAPHDVNAAASRLPDTVGAFAQCRSGRTLIGLAKGLGTASLSEVPNSGVPRRTRVRPLVAVDPAEARTRIHDGRTDRQGSFVFGTRNGGIDGRAIGSFYQYSQQHGLRRLALPAVAVANSICFSVDGGTLYFADTPTARILQCDYHAESAQVSNVRTFAVMDEAGALPEGAVVDRDGNLWSAQSGTGSVLQYAPDGRVLRRIRLPVSAPSAAAFGGSAHDCLMVSSAQGLFAVPGALAIGLPDTLFDDHGKAVPN